MKIYYILKKGFQCYPPCLAQLLYLNDLGVELEVYHGNNSDTINDILNKRGITHYTLKSDRNNSNRLQSMQTLLQYTVEMRSILNKLPDDGIVWFGNCESVITVWEKMRSRKFVLSVLELDDLNSLIGRRLKKFIHKASAVLCCEKHRAAIMRIYYKLDREPYVLPNKPYEIENGNLVLEEEFQKILEPIRNKFILIYQGIVSSDRPLDKIAEALNKMNDDDIVFLVLGKANKEYQLDLKSRYAQTVFAGYIPSPQHLLVTQYAKIGIANYDYSCLNNLFCAPNKIYEYSKFGIPMLTSQNLGLTETVGVAKAGVCVDFLSVDQIIAGIKEIKENYHSYSAAATAFYEETSNVEKIKEIIESI
ncbi:MAG: glycosyltransferase family 4 protein [Ruminococcaceae bacterium]|nr:glycosyltransferase family 4 protein [Oscillospiraceae bacterium]